MESTFPVDQVESWRAGELESWRAGELESCFFKINTSLKDAPDC